MDIGRRIAYFRKEKNITQEQLGEAVGVTNRTVSKWESGVSSPGIDLIPTIASALGITLDQLFGIETPKESADISQVIKETISSSVKEYLEENLPQYVHSQGSEDGYFLTILSRDKSTACRFDGQGEAVYHTILKCYCVIILHRGDDAPTYFQGYHTKEAAVEDLKRILQAYSARLAVIEL
jgi:transcriptional regulator with XRE-family HTH domain